MTGPSTKSGGKAIVDFKSKNCPGLAFSPGRLEA